MCVCHMNKDYLLTYLLIVICIVRVTNKMDLEVRHKVAILILLLFLWHNQLSLPLCMPDFSFLF